MNHRLANLPWAPIGLGLVVWTGLLLSTGGTGALGHPLGDTADHIQGMWWFGSELLAGRLPLQSTLTHGPGATPLWFIDPVSATLAMPFRFLGPAGAYNAAVGLQVWLGGLAAWAMGRDLLNTPQTAWFGGLVMTTAPFVLGAIHSGLSEFTGLAPLVVYTWALIRITHRDPGGRSPLDRTWLWAGAALILVAAQSMIFFLGAVLLTACMAVGPGWRQRLLPLAKTAAVAGLPIAGIAWLIQGTLGGPVGPDAVPGWTKHGLPGVDVLGFFWPFGARFPDNAGLGNPGIAQVHYLGWATLALTALGWRHVRSLWAPVGLYALLCLGPVLVVAGQEIPTTQSALPLPLALLYIEPSPFVWVHHPYRLTALLLPFLALFAIAGAARLPAAGQWCAGGLLILDAAVLSPTPLPLSTTDVTPPSIYETLPPGPVLDWPPDATDWNRRYVLWQASHGRTIAYGVNTRLPPVATRDPLFWNLFLQLDDPGSRLWNREDPPRTQPQSSPPLQSAAAQGYASVVLHLEALTAQEREETRTQLTRQLGAPRFETDTEQAWLLRP